MTDSRERIHGIDGLRAIAVIGVIVFHLIPWILPGGFVGVDVFFVISGYVVCSSLLKQIDRPIHELLSEFYVKRLLRIYPALLAMLFTVGVLNRMFVPDAWFSRNTKITGFFAFFGLSNFQLALENDNYFAPTVDFNAYLHTWTLGVEEQFYVLFPFLLYAVVHSCLLRNRVFRFGSSHLLSIFCIASIAVAAYQTQYQSELAYYLLPSRFWELAAGGLLCLFHSKRVGFRHNPSWSTAFVWGGIGLIVLAMIATDKALFPIPWALVPVAGSLLCIIGIVNSESGWKSGWLSSKVAVLIGRMSYSLYLWHWPVIVLVRWTVGFGHPMVYVATTILIGMLGAASYYFIELPFQRLKSDQRVFGNLSLLRRDLVLISCCLCAILLVGYAFYQVNRSHSWSDVLAQSRTMHGDDWHISNTEIKHGRITPGIPGKTWEDKTLFVFGDSHASAYSEMLAMLRRQTGVAICMKSYGGYRFCSLVNPLADNDQEAENEIFEDIEKLAKPGDVVFLPSLRVMRFASQWGCFDMDTVIEDRESEEAEKRREVALAEGMRQIRKLRELGLIVVIEAPKPVLLTPLFRCADWFNEMNPIGERGHMMNRSFLLRHREPAMKSIRDIQAEFPDVKVWDPFDVLCPLEESSAYDDGEHPLFFDADHLSSYGNRKLYPSFSAFMETIWTLTDNNHANNPPPSEPDS